MNKSKILLLSAVACVFTTFVGLVYAACNSEATGAKCELNGIDLTVPEEVCVNGIVTISVTVDTDCPIGMFDVSWSGDLGTNVAPGNVWSFSTSYTNISTNTITVTVSGADWPDDPGCAAEATSELVVIEPCEPGNVIDVTLTEGSSPFDFPHYATTMNIPVGEVPWVENLWDGLFESALGGVFPTPEFPFSAAFVQASLSKLFKDKCCFDEETGCYRYGKYRYTSKRVNLSSSPKIDPPWASNETVMTILTIAQQAIEILAPDSPQAAAVAYVLGLAQGYKIPMQLIINDWVTNESDECNNCDPPVPDCETGLRRIAIKFPTYKEAKFNFVFETYGWGYFEWRGSRLGLENRKETRYGAEVWVKISYDHGQAWLPVPEVYSRDFKIGPFINATTNTLCM